METNDSEEPESDSSGTWNRTSAQIYFQFREQVRWASNRGQGRDFRLDHATRPAAICVSRPGR